MPRRRATAWRAVSGLVVLESTCSTPDNAMLLARRLTLSLHVAFAAFATFVVGEFAAAAGFAALTVAVGWSRLELGRHSRIDVLVGALAGALAGAWFVLA